MAVKNKTVASNPPGANNLESSAIDPEVLRFILALVVVSVLVTVIDQVSRSAAWTVVVIIILGLLLNNPIAIGLISLGGKSLTKGVT